MSSFEAAQDNNKPRLKAPSLRQFISIKDVVNSPMTIYFKYRLQRIKRMSSFSSLRLSAGMALEGCLVFPVFLFFLMTLILQIEAIRLHSNITEALHQAGNAFCFSGYGALYGKVNPIHADIYVKEYLEDCSEPDIGIYEEKTGIKITEAFNVSGEGTIGLTAEYKIKPFIYLLPIGNIVLKNNFFSHAWTGYTGDGSNSFEQSHDEYVYITETGQKYHRNCECVYLKVNIQAADKNELETLRNQSGERYRVCERCGAGNNSLIFITSYGNKYHAGSNCSSLIRKVYMIPLSEVESRTPCSKCG